MFLVKLLSVCMCVFLAAAVSFRVAPMKKYITDRICMETYGTTLRNYYKIRNKATCGVKCTETNDCQSALYWKNAGWCNINSEVFLNKTATGCSSHVDYLEVTTNNTGSK